MKNLIVPLGV